MARDWIDFLLGIRVRGRPAIAGIGLLAVLAFSLVVFLIAGNARVKRVLFFPVDRGRRLTAETRFLPRHNDAEGDLRELVEGVILGPMRHDASRIFPRDAAVNSVLMYGRALSLDLSQSILAEDPEIPLKGSAALDALVKTIRFNFPRIRDMEISIDGQRPRFSEKKKS